MDDVGKVSSKRFEKFLLKIGCQYKGQESRHIKYKKPGVLRPVIVPKTKELPDFIIMSNLRTLGVSRDEFVKIIKDL